jgi:CubicO group peptidase (beta-lactamase class C family)
VPVLTLAAPVVVAVLSLAAPQAPALASATRERLERLVAGLHAKGLFDGAVVVGRRDVVLWEKGVGEADAERHVPFTPDTPVDGASLAKTFTAALLLSLQSEGRLTLDEPAQRLLPELPYREITLRQLLSHSSGLPDYYEYFEPFVGKDQVRTNEILLGVMAAQEPPLAFRPGTRFEYSSFAYDLAALAACRAARATYEALLQQRVFRPLGITSAFVRPGRLADFPGVRTRGYRHVGERLEPNEVFDLEAFHGGSNVYISTRDLHLWNASFLTRPVLGRAALQEGLRAARIAGSPSGLTLLSWYSAPDRSSFWYSGHLQGFHSVVFRDVKTGDSIAYGSNNTLDAWLQHGLIRGIRSILAGKESEPLPPSPTAPLPRESWRLLSGKWRMDDGERFSIEPGERLFIRRNGVAYLMVPVDPRTFYVPGLDFMIGLARDERGGRGFLRVSSNLRLATASRRAAP